MVVDGQVAVVGSYNFDHRADCSDLELCLISSQPAADLLLDLSAPGTPPTRSPVADRGSAAGSQYAPPRIPGPQLVIPLVAAAVERPGDPVEAAGIRSKGF